MINFEKMNLEQIKKYVCPDKLEQLEDKELGKLLTVAHSAYNFYLEESGIDAMVEVTFWKAAEQEVKKEFAARNIEVKVMDFRGLYSSINEELKVNYRSMREVLRTAFSEFREEDILQVKQELMDMPEYEQRFGKVLDIINEYLGVSTRRQMLN